MIVRRLLLASFAGLLLLGACRKAEITTYRIPKEKDPEMPMAKPAPPGDMANTAVPTADGPTLTWTAPSHWESKPASAMRKATFVMTGEGGATAELSVTAFPGDMGGELANLNRWRGQLKLPPVGEAELEKAVTRQEHDGLSFGLVDLAGGGQRMLGAWVPYAKSMWFFKLGPASDALVGREKEAFQAFVASVKPSASTTR